MGWIKRSKRTHTERERGRVRRRDTHRYGASEVRKLSHEAGQEPGKDHGGGEGPKEPLPRLLGREFNERGVAKEEAKDVGRAVVADDNEHGQEEPGVGVSICGKTKGMRRSSGNSALLKYGVFVGVWADRVRWVGCGQRSQRCRPRSRCR